MNNGSKGVCKALAKCSIILNSWKYIGGADSPVICGFMDKTAIVCCPNFTHSATIELIDENQVKAFDGKCFNKEMNMNGYVERIIKCPYALNLIEKGIIPSELCPYEICSDLVCCVEEKCSETGKECRSRYQPSLISNRLSNQLPCRLPNTNNYGIYLLEEECNFPLKSDLPKTCDWYECSRYVCCPLANINGSRMLYRQH